MHSKVRTSRCTPHLFAVVVLGVQKIKDLYRLADVVPDKPKELAPFTIVPFHFSGII